MEKRASTVRRNSGTTKIDDQEERMENLKRDAALRAPAFLHENLAVFQRFSSRRGRSMPLSGHPPGNGSAHGRSHRSRNNVIHSLKGSSGSHCSAIMSSLPQQGTFQETCPEHRRGGQRSKNFNRLSYCKIANGAPAGAPCHIRGVCADVQRVANGCTNGVHQQLRQSATVR